MTPELQARARGFAGLAGEMARQRRLAVVESEAIFTRDSEAAEAAPPPKTPELPLRGAAEEATVPVRPPDALLRPTPGEVVQRFGDALPSGGRANGVTLAAARGARVASPAAGLVQYVGPVKGWGVI
jgi:septal ring factor EnvC (AmiA/AmiB activator)